VFDGVSSLLNKNLVQQQRTPGDEELRLVMLETIREYGWEALAASGQVEVTRQAHAAYYLWLVEEAEPALSGAQQVVWLERLEREHDNLRAAMQWSLEQGETRGDGQRMEMALRMGGALRWFWMVRGHYSEGRTFLERALVGSESTVPSVRAKALCAAALLVNVQGDTEQAEALAQESLALCRALADPQGIADSLYLLGHVAWLRGNFAMAGSLLEEGLGLFRQVGDKASNAYSLFNLAGLASIQGAYARAPALFEGSLALFRELGNKRGIALALLQLAEVLFHAQKDQTRVRELLEEGRALCKELGDKDGLAFAFAFSGRIELSQGDTFTARALLEESLALYRDMGDRQRIAQSLCALGKVAAVQGNGATARALYEESLVIARVGHKLNMALGLEGLASVVAAQGEPKWAARLWGTADALRDAMGAPMAPVERLDYEQAVAAARAFLGERVFAAAWVEGRTMPLEQALAAQEPAPMPMPLSIGQPLAPSAKPSATSLAGLTRREIEVLHLLTMGLTNTQISEQLGISLSTVNTHVGSIYNKLGVTSRSAATRYAVEHHLV
jgi:ATP/maltotriose-dependent transcriptional regulator MalT